MCEYNCSFCAFCEVCAMAFPRSAGATAWEGRCL